MLLPGVGEFVCLSFILVLLPSPLTPAPPLAPVDGKRKKNRKIVSIHLFKWIFKIKIYF